MFGGNPPRADSTRPNPCHARLSRMRAPTSPTPARVGYAADQEPPVQSLFRSDQAFLSDDAVARILSSHVDLPTKPRLAVIRFPEGGRYYWRDEEFLRIPQAQIEAPTQSLAGTEQITSITPLPSLMIPSRIRYRRSARPHLGAGRLAGHLPDR